MGEVGALGGPGMNWNVSLGIGSRERLVAWLVRTVDLGKVETAPRRGLCEYVTGTN